MVLDRGCMDFLGLCRVILRRPCSNFDKVEVMLLMLEVLHAETTGITVV